MNILFTAFSIGKGVGGHLRSMKHVKEKVSQYHKCFVIIFGQYESPILDYSESEIFINIKSKSYLYVRSEINKFIHSNSIAIIHSFDEFSYVLCQLGHNLPRLLTRCGGPNPNRYPYAKYITCFSKENYNYFHTNSKYKDSEIHLIPNRVRKFECNKELVRDLEQIVAKEANDIILLRITRIGKENIKSIIQSVNLLKEFQKYSTNRIPKLIILGAVYSEEIFEWLLTEFSNVNNLFFITDNKFTNDAKNIIDIANIVIGTGRGLMEASSKGKIIFAPVNDLDLPELITEHNFDDFFYYNFSGRSKPEITKRPKTTINELIQEEALLSQYSVNLFDKYFNIESAIHLYLSIYVDIENAKQPKNKISTLLFYLAYCKYIVFKNY